LRILKDQGVVAGRRQGTFVYYEVSAPNVFLILDCIVRHGRG
jgi:DNA-binding transcriptional ArsR family regulator